MQRGDKRSPETERKMLEKSGTRRNTAEMRELKKNRKDSKMPGKGKRRGQKRVRK